MGSQSKREALESDFGCVAFEVLMKCSQSKQAQVGG